MFPQNLQFLKLSGLFAGIGRKGLVNNFDHSSYLALREGKPCHKHVTRSGDCGGNTLLVRLRRLMQGNQDLSGVSSRGGTVQQEYKPDAGGSEETQIRVSLSAVLEDNGQIK